MQKKVISQQQYLYYKRLSYTPPKYGLTAPELRGFFYGR
jgi:hypothetical protein